MAKPKLVQRDGQPSWRLASKDIEAYVTRLGGQLGPVIFDRKKRKIAPFSVAPWCKEKLPKDTPAIIRALRGDFFCMPFGGNATAFNGENHPLHGQPANDSWKLESLSSTRGETTLHLSLRTTIRRGRVDKTITLRDGEPALYCRHVVSEMTGPMNFGHHAMLHFSGEEGSGLLSTSAIAGGQVFPGQFEDPALGGYNSLLKGAIFDDLSRVPMANGQTTDLTRYPARLGFEDLVMVTQDHATKLAWSAVSFPKERFVWFALKDPRVLTQTVLWLSNRGRHYAPWSSRHIGVLGIEDITGYFHYGLAESSTPNPVSARGYATHVQLNGTPMTVNYIMACAPTPPGFDRVTTIAANEKQDEVTLTTAGGIMMRVPIHLKFLGLGE